MTLDDKSKHILLDHEVRNLGFQEWKEFMFCISQSSLKVRKKKRVINLVQNLLTMAKMMGEISPDEANQTYIGLTKFKDPKSQRVFVQMCKEVLVGDGVLPDGVIFQDLKYYKEQVEGLCF